MCLTDAGKKRKWKPVVYDFQTFADAGCPIDPKGAFRDNIPLFLQECAQRHQKDVGRMSTWCTLLEHGSSTDVAVPLYTILEDVQSTQRAAYCDHCRCAGWGNHLVSRRNYHLIIPAPDEWNKRLVDDFVDLDTHLLHGLIHCNGFGHLLQINGIEGGSKYLCGRELMDLWDRICTNLRTRKITVQDFSRKRVMDLRLLYGVGYGHSWYGKWGYKFCRGSFGVAELDYNRALQSLRSLELDQIVNDFSDMDKCREIKQIIRHYRDKSETQLITLNDLLGFMLTIRSHAPVRVNKKATFEDVSDYSPIEISQDELWASVNEHPGMEAALEMEPEAAGAGESDENDLTRAVNQFRRPTQNPIPVQDEAHQLVHGGAPQVGIPQEDGAEHLPVHVNKKATVEEVSGYSPIEIPPSEVSQDELWAFVNEQPGMEAAPEMEPEAAGAGESDENDLMRAVNQFRGPTQNPIPVQDEAHQLVHGGAPQVGIPQEDGAGHLPIHPSSSTSKPSTRIILQPKPLVKKGKSMEDRSLKSVIAKMEDVHRPAKRLEYAAEVIVNALKRNNAGKFCHGKMTRQDLRDAARVQIGDTGLLDYVLKSLDDVIVGTHVVSRTKNPTTRIYEYSLHELGNGIEASEPDTEVLPMPLSALDLEPGVDVYDDLVYLYRNILVDYPGSDWVNKETRVVLNSKYFVKEWPYIDEKDEFLTFTCRLIPFFGVIETELNNGFPPGEVVVVTPHATVGDLKEAVKTAVRDTYCIAENFLVKGIEELEGLKDEAILVGAVASGTCLSVMVIGLALRRQAGVESWRVSCICGTEDYDVERMVACNHCNVWQHSHCCGIKDSEDIPRFYLCKGCQLSISNM